MVKPLLVVLCLLIAGAARGASPAITYEIHPDLKDGALTALAVRMTFTGDASGRTTLLLPDTIDHGDGAKPDRTDLQVSGATVESSDKGVEVLRAAPGAPIAVSYRIVSGYDGVPAMQPFHALLLPTWFAVDGGRALLRVEGRGDAPATVRMAGLPAGWIWASDFGAGGARTMDEVNDGYLIGGSGWQELDEPMGAARLRLFYRPETKLVAPESAARLLADIAAGDFAYWGDPPWDLFVPVIPSGSETGGHGMVHGFILQAVNGDDLTADKHTFAHEHTHSWISRQVGGFPATQPDLEAWLNEGFTELTTARELLKSGLWTPSDFAGDLNAALLEYGVSPVQTAPNSRIGADRFADFDVGKLPYLRGRMMGLIWERRLRAATGGRVGLQDALQAQRGLALRAKAAGQETSADKLFPVAVRQASGVDLSDDLSTYIDQGAAITLPADLFGACGTFETVTQPPFDRGFDLMASVRNGKHLVGLEPGGPAERAGLREGNHLGIDEVITHNSQLPLTYKVDQPDGTRRAITYKPEGQGTVTFQRLRLNASLDAAGEARCRRVLTGEIAP